jgi:hypothetical protein
MKKSHHSPPKIVRVGHLPRLRISIKYSYFVSRQASFTVELTILLTSILVLELNHLIEN